MNTYNAYVYNSPCDYDLTSGLPFEPYLLELSALDNAALVEQVRLWMDGDQDDADVPLALDELRRREAQVPDDVIVQAMQFRPGDRISLDWDVVDQWCDEWADVKGRGLAHTERAQRLAMVMVPFEASMDHPDATLMGLAVQNGCVVCRDTSRRDYQVPWWACSSSSEGMWRMVRTAML